MTPPSNNPLNTEPEGGPEPNRATPAMPPGIGNAYLFQIFNSTSWSIILGSTVLLYVKELGASGFLLGVTVSLTPLFAALQIPAADFAERIGYKVFVVRGWTSRSIFILGAAVVPLLPLPVPPAVRIYLILAMLACFAAARGISVCGYMPWITQLIPETLRGRFIAVDTLCIHLAVTGTMLFSSGLLRLFPDPRAYAVLFGISYLAALGSVFFLKRVPDPPPPEPRHRSVIRPPWLAMLRHPPFFRIVVFNVANNLFISALGVIWLPFMRDAYGASPSLILGLSAYSSVICAATSFLVGPIADRTGSRPLLAVAGGLIILSQAVWLAVAAGLLPHLDWLPFAIITLGAPGFATLMVANVRLLMGAVPAIGRSHFFAINSVASSLTMGIMPILWGLALDALGRLDQRSILPAAAPRWAWNRFSLLYGLVIAGLLAAQFLRRRIQEPRAMSTHALLQIMLVESPRKLAARTLAAARRFMPFP